MFTTAAVPDNPFEDGVMMMSFYFNRKWRATITYSIEDGIVSIYDLSRDNPKMDYLLFNWLLNGNKEVRWLKSFLFMVTPYGMNPNKSSYSRTTKCMRHPNPVENFDTNVYTLNVYDEIDFNKFIVDSASPREKTKLSKWFDSFLKKPIAVPEPPKSLPLIKFEANTPETYIEHYEIEEVEHFPTIISFFNGGVWVGQAKYDIQHDKIEVLSTFRKRSNVKGITELLTKIYEREVTYAY